MMVLNHEEDSLLALRTSLSTSLTENPYDFRLYIGRAEYYEQIGYPDLAAGDAYRGLCLIDDVEDGEYSDQIHEALGSNGQEALEDRSMVHIYAIRAYAILSRSLFACGDVQSAFDFGERGTKAYPTEKVLQDLCSVILERHGRPVPHDGRGNSAISTCQAELRSDGSVRREIYAWNNYEPDRFSEESLTILNSELQNCTSNCKISAVELPVLAHAPSHGSISRTSQQQSSKPTLNQLGLFATRDIAPFEPVLLEPSVLTVNNRFHDPLCDACSALLPKISHSSPLPTCTSCTDIYFCSDACHDRAQEMYHPAICGNDDYHVVAKDPSPATATDALYLLLVARTIAMAETQDMHPLDLPQVKYLWGDFSPSSSVIERKLPFNFHTNIAHPIHILTKMGIDPFATATLERYDTWVLNTLFAKFRGVASAKVNPQTLRPDVAAVHPLWSMANHSCAPNVRWEWGAEDGDLRGKENGTMGFAARGGKEVVQWGGKKREGGIKKGEEILNHYCDVDMNVKERREWAIGALGGICQCPRCMWEADHNSKIYDKAQDINSEDSMVYGRLWIDGA